MFRHKKMEQENQAPSAQESEGGAAAVGEKKASVTETAKPESSLKELMEKNLKWSQIIYEQNRKINNKLLWVAIFSWFKIFVIVGLIVWAVISLQPMVSGFLKQYGSFLGLEQAAGVNPASLDTLLKIFNLDPAQQAQLKALLK